MKWIIGWICLLAIMPVSAWAHRVVVFAWPEGDQIHVESKFSGGKPAQQAAVDVYDASDRKILSGQTDDQGRFTFTPPAGTGLNIVVNAGTGHQGQWRLSLEDMGQAPMPTTSVEPAPAAPQPRAPAEQAPCPALDNDIEARLSTMLDRKLDPIKRDLAYLRRPEPSMRDIFSGIGYILGLVGLAAYLQYRQKLKQLGHDH